MRNLHLFKLSIACCALTASAVGTAQVVTTEAASSVTQTHATLTAKFAAESTSNGFQFKYGDLVSLTDFSSHVLSSTSDPITLVMGGEKNFYWREAKEWAENERGLTAGQESTLSSTFTLTYPTSIEFDWCTDSEEDMTSFVFYVDGVATEHAISGLQDNPNKPEFRHVSHSLPAGEHTVAWKFMKKGDTNVGGDIGILRNIHVTNTTPRKWLTKPAASSELILDGLYPSQKYLYRAYSIVNGDSVFSRLQQFETKEVSISKVSVTDTTQATATITGKAYSGDAEVEKGFIVWSSNYRDQLDKFGKALVQQIEEPITIERNERWTFNSKNNYVTNSSSTRGAGTLTIKFTLTKPTKVSFNWYAKGHNSYFLETAYISFSVDGKYKESFRAPEYSYTASTGSYSITLTEGTHTLTWGDYTSIDTSHDIRISDLRIGSCNIDDYNQTIPISQDDMQHVLQGLQPNTVYNITSYMRPTFDSELEERWPAEATYSDTITFKTRDVSTKIIGAENLMQSSATIRAEVNGGDATIAARGIQYKTADATAWSDIKTVTGSTELSATLKRLKPSTEYQYRSYIQAQNCDTVFSPTASFTTLSVEALQPSVIAQTQHTATINAQVVMGDAVIYTRGLQIRPKYGKWIDYEDGGEEETYTRKFDKLVMNTLYETRTYIQPQGLDTIYSNVLSFCTKNVEAYADSVTNIHLRRATLHGHVSVGDDTATEKVLKVFNMNQQIVKEVAITTTDTLFSETVTELTPGEYYYFQIGVKGTTGDMIYSQTTAFQTLYPICINDLKPEDVTQTTASISAIIANSAITSEFGESPEEIGYIVTLDMDKREVLPYAEGMETIDFKITDLHPGREYAIYVYCKLGGKEYLSLPTYIGTMPISFAVTYSDIHQTTATMKTKVESGDAKVENMQYSIDGGSTWNDFATAINLTQLQPDADYRPVFRWYVSGVEYTYTAPGFHTQAVTVQTSIEEICPTSALVSFNYNIGNATYTHSGIFFNGEYIQAPKDDTHYRITGLNPGTTYSYRAYVMTEEGGTIMTQEYRFQTQNISVDTQDATNISNRSAQFNALVYCDTYSNAEFGFEWKGMGNEWLADPVFTRGTKLDNGTMTLGLISGMLEPNKDYQFRAVVKYNGRTYTGAWKNFHTELEYVFYAAKPVTLYRTDRETNSIILCGYYIQGSEEVIKQGYEYWQQDSQVKQKYSATSTATTRVETGENMQYTLDTSILADGTYCVRAFVQTATSTYYGETLTFGIGENVSINTIQESKPTCAGATGHIVFRNTEGHSCRIFNISGKVMAEQRNMPQTEQRPMQPGIYVVRFDTGSTIKVIVR